MSCDPVLWNQVQVSSGIGKCLWCDKKEMQNKHVRAITFHPHKTCTKLRLREMLAVGCIMDNYVLLLSFFMISSYLHGVSIVAQGVKSPGGVPTPLIDVLVQVLTPLLTLQLPANVPWDVGDCDWSSWTPVTHRFPGSWPGLDPTPAITAICRVI